MDKTTTGVIVGRFQVPTLHSAHLELINQVFKNHSRVIIFLGTTEVQISDRNGLDFDQRRMMLISQCTSVYQAGNLIIVPLPDTSNNDTWSKALDARIAELCPNGKAALYGGRGSFGVGSNCIFRKHNPPMVSAVKCPKPELHCH